MVQGWIDEFGTGQALQDRVEEHARYWLAVRENPSLPHEQILELIANADTVSQLIEH